jgi:uncharacterized metal-binding protein YceD (DUF177 family)
MEHTAGVTAANEFSRPLIVADLGAAIRVEHIEADALERCLLAKRFVILEIECLVADLQIKRIKRGRYVRIEGRLAAEVVQECVVTLDPVRSRIEESFTLLFGGDDGEKKNRAVVVALEEEAEPIIDGLIDLGEVVAEQLALALPPYPRSPAADTVPEKESQVLEKPRPLEESAENPFSVLASLKRGQ